MPNEIRDLHTIDKDSYSYIFEKNASVKLKSSDGLVRLNVYRPKIDKEVPVLVTYGPYGKDIHYKDFHPKSFSEVNPQHKSEHSAWETPDPAFWTRHGYAVVRADERGTGQSPGKLDTMSRGTSEAFAEVIEWCADQPWSSGKVGLLGISYYAGTQWRVAARQPKGLSCMIPWEGMSDYYRDRCRHGGILSNQFISFWWNRQVITNQYGRPGRQEANWGPDTIEGDLNAKELERNRQDQTVDTAFHRYLDEDYYFSKDFSLSDIKVPLLSVANWGGILLHLRGNTIGWMNAGSELKYLRFITGRHDLPFYYEDEVEIQRSFLDAFLKGEDRVGWSMKGKLPSVSLTLRKGDVGYNHAQAERMYERRSENEWPIRRTMYTRFFLYPDRTLRLPTPDAMPFEIKDHTLSYKALGTIESPQLIQFTTLPFMKETEITGHLVAHLCVSASKLPQSSNGPSDIDLFLTLRHISPQGKEIFYTGTTGDPVPLTKGWLRASLRKVDEHDPKHREWLPRRNYRSIDVQKVEPDTVYEIDVEIWPTNVIVNQGGKLILEVSSGDTQGCGIFGHNHPEDRSDKVFEGLNKMHFGSEYVNYVTLPIIPPKGAEVRGNET